MENSEDIMEYNEISDKQETIENNMINKLNYENKMLINSLKNDGGKQLLKELDEPFLKPIKKTLWFRFKEWWNTYKNKNYEEY